MYWQFEFLRKSRTLAIGATDTLLLPANGLLAGLILHIRGTPVVDSMNAVEKWRMLDYVSKIEVIGNGSPIIKSMTGRMAHFYAYLCGGIPGPDKHFNYGTSTKRCHLFLPFGRKLYDMKYGIDLAAWKSVEIKITNDGSGTYWTGDLTADIEAVWLRDGPPGAFASFLKTEEWRSLSTVQNKHEYLDLPEEGVLRNLIFQVDPAVDSSKAAKTTLYTVLDEIKLTKRSGRDILFDSSLRDLWYLEAFDDGKQILQPLEPYHTTAYGVRTGLGQTLGEAGLRMPQGGTQNTYGTGIWPGDDSSTMRRGVASDNTQDAWLVTGLGLENCAHFRFDQQEDEASWMDLKAEGQVSLDLHTADDSNAASGTVRIVLDRVAIPPV